MFILFSPCGLFLTLNSSTRNWTRKGEILITLPPMVCAPLVCGFKLVQFLYIVAGSLNQWEVQPGSPPPKPRSRAFSCNRVLLILSQSVSSVWYKIIKGVLIQFPSIPLKRNCRFKAYRDLTLKGKGRIIIKLCQICKWITLIRSCNRRKHVSSRSLNTPLSFCRVIVCCGYPKIIRRSLVNERVQFQSSGGNYWCLAWLHYSQPGMMQ